MTTAAMRYKLLARQAGRGSDQSKGRGCVAEATSSPGERAVQVGADLFAQKSYGAATTRELARALGVTNGTFYHYYPNKEDLLLDICLEALAGIIAAAEQAIASTEAGEQRLRALIEGHVSATLRDQNLHRTMLVEMRSLGRAATQRIVPQRDRYADLVDEIVADAQREGFLRADVDFRALGLILLNLLNWTVFWLGDEVARSEPEIVRLVSTVFFEGNRRKP
jgi:AcrR family transcriptional regulator